MVDFISNTLNFIVQEIHKDIAIRDGGVLE